MNEDLVVATFVVTDDVLKHFGHRSHVLAEVSDAEVVWVAIMTALYFQNHQERALYVLRALGYVRGLLSISRFNRRLHQVAHWLLALLSVLSDLWRTGEVFILDSLPVPVCKRVRARRCRKVRGAEYCGWCAAKRERFFGWRLHLICTAQGVPVAFDLLPAALHDLTPIHELTADLPAAACVYGDKAYNCLPDEATIQAEVSVRLIPVRRVNMQSHDWADDFDLALYRRRIETVYSQLESRGVERLHARTQAGLEIRLHASLLALAFKNLNYSRSEKGLNK